MLRAGLDGSKDRGGVLVPDEDRATIRKIVAEETQAIVNDVSANVLTMLQQLAAEFAETQRLICEGITSHHETLKLVVAAVRDLQNATGVLVDRIGVGVDRPDADER